MGQRAKLKLDKAAAIEIKIIPNLDYLKKARLFHTLKCIVVNIAKKSLNQFWPKKGDPPTINVFKRPRQETQINEDTKISVDLSPNTIYNSQVFF